MSQSTVARHMRRHPRRSPSQTWRTFLSNHAAQITAADLFVVPTVTFRLLFVLVILAYDRRRIVRIAVTEHSTAAWIAQLLRNAFPENEAPRYLLHDRDGAFADVPATMAAMDMQAVRTAPIARASSSSEPRSTSPCASPDSAWLRTSSYARGVASRQSSRQRAVKLRPRPSPVPS